MMPAGYCNPDGIAFDLKKNLWYVDVVNGVEVLLTAASHYNTVGGWLFYGPGYGSTDGLVGIAIDSKGNHWVVDTTCAGNLYENTVFTGFSAGDALDSIAISSSNPSHKPHIYVGVTNFCGNYLFPFVGDWTDYIVLPHPYESGGDAINGISTLLYFTDWSYNWVWVTTDTV